MKIKIILILSLLLTCITTSSLSKEIKTKLTLFKSIEDYRTIIMKGRLCKTFRYIKKDLSSLSDIGNRFCGGEYSLSLEGSAGTTVTLYEQYFFSKGRGYLVLTKTDDKKIRGSDIDNFSPESWTVSPANKDTGGATKLFQNHLLSSKQTWHRFNGIKSPDTIYPKSGDHFDSADRVIAMD